MNDELSAMHDRALQAEQALIEARNYHKDEVARLEERLRAAEALSVARVQEIPLDARIVAVFCELMPEHLDDASEFGERIQERCGTDTVVAWFLSGSSIEALNSEQLAAAGLVRTAVQLTAHQAKDSRPAPSKSPIWFPTPDKLWLASCPEMGLEFYATEQEALDAGANFIEGHIGDDGWDEAVDQVFVAEVKHITRQTDVVKRPPDDELDEDGCDEDGNYWSGDHDCRCNYRLEAVGPRGSIGSSEAIKEVLNQAIMVVAYRAGDVSTEDGNYATTCTDSIIHLESALCEALGTKHDEIDLTEAGELMNKLFASSVELS